MDNPAETLAVKQLSFPSMNHFPHHKNTPPGGTFVFGPAKGKAQEQISGFVVNTVPRHGGAVKRGDYAW